MSAQQSTEPPAGEHSVGVLAAQFAAGRPVITAWCGIPEPAIAGMLAREPGLDAVTLDMQHGAYDYSAAARAIPLVAAAGKPAIVRVPIGEFQTASRMLDAGASAIIAPMVNSVEDARRFAGSVKFPPGGERSWGPHGALALTGLDPGAYLRRANGFSLSFAMVETREALGLVDDILAVEGLDGIFLGPSDLSITLSGGAEINALSGAVDEAVAHALARARAAGKRVGIYAVTGERAATFAGQGFDLVALASDTAFLRVGAGAMIAAART